MPGRIRCRLHGGLAGRPAGIPAHPNSARAMAAGRQRWLQRMRLAKQQGLIARFPNGRRPRGAPKLYPDRTIRQAQKIIKAWMAKDASLRVVPDDEPPVPLTPEEQAALAASKAAAARGEFASDEEVRAVWAKGGPASLECRPEPVDPSTKAQGQDTPASGPEAAESSEEAEELLEELVAALFEAPNPLDEADEGDSLWSVVAGELSDELYDRLDGWIAKRMASAE
jgi:predicted transcriptional regulator